jgi:ABC-type sugar transport system ATPase subunit
MSGGEQQMLAIGRALMSNPRILMLDEPSLGLSPLLCRELFRALRHIGETGVGILLVEQNARQSLAIADRAYLLETGRIVGAGRAAAMLHDPAVQRAYLGGAARLVDAMSAAASAPPAAAMPRPRSTADLAARAAEIARAHVAARRDGQVNGHAGSNGHATRFVAEHQGEAIIVSKQADELSRRAAEFAARAAQIHAEHVVALREQAVAAPPPVLGSGRKKDKAAKKAKKKGKSKGKG